MSTFDNYYNQYTANIPALMSESPGCPYDILVHYYNAPAREEYAVSVCGRSPDYEYNSAQSLAILWFSLSMFGHSLFITCSLIRSKDIHTFYTANWASIVMELLREVRKEAGALHSRYYNAIVAFRNGDSEGEW